MDGSQDLGLWVNNQTESYVYQRGIILPISVLPNERKDFSLLAAGEGVGPSSSSSKPDVLPITPSRKNLGAQASSLLSFVWQIHGGRLEALRTQDRLVAVEGIEPASLDYQSSALAVE